MIPTRDQLIQIMPNAVDRVGTFYEPLSRAMVAYQVQSALELAAFLATIAEESGELRWTREIWGPTQAQLTYENRASLGNHQPGDGFRYRGRGLIQVTGRANYEQMGKLLQIDLIGSPELLEAPVHACFSAVAFWWSRDLNSLADRSDFRAVTRKVNGGLTNIARREAYYVIAKEVLHA